MLFFIFKFIIKFSVCKTPHVQDKIKIKSINSETLKLYNAKAKGVKTSRRQ
jgi:hypothetical protein